MKMGRGRRHGPSYLCRCTGGSGLRHISCLRLRKPRFSRNGWCRLILLGPRRTGTATRVNQSKRFINHNVVVVALRGDLATHGWNQPGASKLRDSGVLFWGFE
ncbi:hypothetical protein SJ05684_c22550 [Sinorhizobium sojae CCBAU 05684]|uniref:Uncharacterized protein n=1 Tax=Sinorhizobium sojae CCBAU 05684 TaxID=716928 RepID=A0A249PCZ3_9HYPH|nr:hypothetical protein SJ05684_c22550 [Sinorhizobium sojae CCBAU 05684]